MSSELKIDPERIITWEQWLAGREKRRAMGRIVAPDGARRAESSADKRLRSAFNGERGPMFPDMKKDG